MNKKKYHIFCDESGFKETYLIIGGLFITDSIKNKLLKDIINIKKKPEYLYMKLWEMKAEKCNNEARYKLYSEILEALFHYDFKYSATVFDNRMYNHQKFYDYQDKAKDKGFYAFYSIMIYNNFIKMYTDKQDYFLISIDERHNLNNKTHTEWMKLKLLSRDYQNGNFKERIADVKEFHSKKCILLQVSDLITYAISFFHNENRVVKNEYKIKLAKKVATLFSQETLNKSIETSNLKIWKCNLQK